MSQISILKIYLQLFASVHILMSLVISQFKRNFSAVSDHKAEIMETLIDDALWRTSSNDNVQVLVIGIIQPFQAMPHLLQWRYSWPSFIYGAGIPFFQTSEPVLCPAFVDSSWIFHIIDSSYSAFALSLLILSTLFIVLLLE